MRRLFMVARPALLGHTFVIKAHSGPTIWARAMIQSGLIRATYIYRDPRDAMLSAMDYGGRALAKGRQNAFSHLTGFDQALDFMLGYVRIWAQWMREPNMLTARYEDLLMDYETEVSRLMDYLHLNTSQTKVRDVIDRYRPEGAEGRQGTHFFKGKIGRFREVFSADQQAALAQRFGPFLARMGYAV